MKITGSVIEAYIVCPRQAWLLSRQITANQNNDYLRIGKLISEESYKREKKEIVINSGKVDFIKKENNTLILGEIKKSKKQIFAAKMQLLFYMDEFYKKGYNNIKGEIKIPKSKNVITVEYTEQNMQELNNLIEDMTKIISSDILPKIEFKNLCKKCAQFEFCWS